MRSSRVDDAVDRLSHGSVARSSSRRLLFGCCLEAPEAVVPERLEPGSKVRDACRPGTVPAPDAVTTFVDQPSLTEDREVLRDGRPGDVEPRGDRAPAVISRSRTSEQDGSAVRFRDGSELGVHAADVSESLT